MIEPDSVMAVSVPRVTPGSMPSGMPVPAPRVSVRPSGCTTIAGTCPATQSWSSPVPGSSSAATAVTNWSGASRTSSSSANASRWPGDGSTVIRPRRPARTRIIVVAARTPRPITSPTIIASVPPGVLTASYQSPPTCSSSSPPGA